MTEEQALEILREELPEYEFDLQDTGGLDIVGLLEVRGPEGIGTHELSLEVLDALDREGVSDSQARESLVSFVEQSIK